MVLCVLTVAMLLTMLIRPVKNDKDTTVIVPSAEPTTQCTPQNTMAHVIAIDAGHGGQDGGAVGSMSGTPEAGLNLEVAQELKKILEGRGMKVIMTRETEDALGPTKMEDMRKRREILNTDSVEAVVSIHMNKFIESHMI